MRELLLAIRNVLRQQRRSMVGLVAIAAGVAALVFAGGFIDWNLHELRERTIRSEFGHIQVTRSGRGQSQQVAAANLPASSDLKSLIAATKHVSVLAPRLSISGLISRNDTTLAFTGEGVDPALDITSGADNTVAGQPLDSTKPRQIMLGEGLAATLGVKPGDNAVLLVNLSSGGINAADVVIGGTFRTASKAYDDAAVRIPLSLAQNLLKTSGADVWIVTLDATESTAETLAALRANPSLGGLTFTPWTALADFYNKAVVLYARQFAVMKVLIAIIIILSIMNTMMMSVSERTPEIGTMMAIGTRRAAILRMFVSEGFILGMVGGLIGVALGFVVNSAISAIGIPMPPPPGMTHGFVAQASFGWGVVFSAFVLAVATTTAASVVPAFTASRLTIVDALRAAR